MGKSTIKSFAWLSTYILISIVRNPISKKNHKIFLIILEAMKSKVNQIEDYYLTYQVFELKLLNRTNFHYNFILINVGLEYFYQHTDLNFAQLL